MGWETSHRKRNIDQVDLEGIDRDRRRILSGYGTSSKGYSKESEILTNIGVPRDILSGMPDDIDDSIDEVDYWNIEDSLASIDKEASATERKDVLEMTKDIEEMTEEELAQYYADQADKDFNDRLDVIMQH